VTDEVGPGTALLDLAGRRTPVHELLADAWRIRSVVLLLARREFVVRYRRAALGSLWAIALPLLQAVVLAILFSRIVRLHQPHFFVFVFAGMTAWGFFSATLPIGATAIVDGSQLSSKVYFPRLVLPVALVAANVYVVIVNSVILLFACLVSGIGLGPRTALLIPAVALLLALTLTLSLLLSALHVYFRDIRYLVQAGMLLLFYLTPIFYPLQLAGHLTLIDRINPVTGVVELIRAATIGADPHTTSSVIGCCAWIVGTGAVALALHSRYDRLFSDLL